jgi:hypothetical protein
MSMHDVEYFSPRRRAQGIRLRGSVSGARAHAPTSSRSKLRSVAPARVKVDLVVPAWHAGHRSSRRAPDLGNLDGQRIFEGVRPGRPLSQRGAKLQRLKSLPWPRNLFGEHATIAELLTPTAARGEDDPDDLCACGCGKNIGNACCGFCQIPTARDSTSSINLAGATVGVDMDC